jgi:hypothetical protein
MKISIEDTAFLIFAISLISFALYSVVLLISNIYVQISARDVAIFSLSTFIFGFLISSYVDGNAVDMLFSSILLIVVVLFFSYKSIKKKLTDKKAKEVLT